MFFAQTVDKVAGRLDAAGAKGGPVNLAAQPFYVGINDMTGADPTGRPFSRKVFDIFDAWSVFNTGNSGSGSEQRPRTAAARPSTAARRSSTSTSSRSAACTASTTCSGRQTVQGTCSTCHNVPNVGGHAVFRMFDIGAADEDICAATCRC